MALTWASIRDEIIQEYGYLTTDTNLTDKVFNWEKDAVRDISQHYPWWWLSEQIATKTQTSAQNHSLLGVQGKPLKLFYPTTNQEIIHVDPQSLIEENYDLTLAGKPIYYWVIEWVAGTGTAASDVRVQWYPVPNSTYSYKVHYLPFDLGADVDGATATTALPVPPTFYTAIKEYVRSKFSHIDGDLESSQFHFQKYKDDLNIRIAENNRFNTRRLRLKRSDINEDDAWFYGPRLDPNHFRN